MHSAFSHWTKDRRVQSMSTNAGAPELAFQGWRHFKEAFAPELVERAIRESETPVHTCLDPFGGSGTTALACQFLGVHPITVEVNPYLADLIAAKLEKYDSDLLAELTGRVLARSKELRGSVPQLLPPSAPQTLVEPGVKGRWAFDRKVADRIAALLAAISEIEDPGHRRLFKVLLGGILVEVSNVVVNGKGRRYRRGWKDRRRDPDSVESLFGEAMRNAVADIHRHSKRPHSQYTLLVGDARTEVGRISEPYELAVFSPPYPNSFDYTDVYNLELWLLGYLTEPTENTRLRLSTLSSHVQIGRDFASRPSESRLLNEVYDSLDAARSDLWDHRIPEMVGAYFSDMLTMLRHIHKSLADRGGIWMVVGDSQYRQIKIPVADILQELAPAAGLAVTTMEPFRSMRSSAQQGGRFSLDETLVVLQAA